MQYHKKFRNIKEDAILATREVIKMGLFKKEKSLIERKSLIQHLHNKMCSIYDIPTTIIQYDETFEGTGRYDHLTNTIIINKPSLVTYLHELCHNIRILKHQINTEEIARGWSISLYYLATPKLCTKAILEGKILFQSTIEEEQ
jgi:hypothetical protein